MRLFLKIDAGRNSPEKRRFRKFLESRTGHIKLTRNEGRKRRFHRRQKRRMQQTIKKKKPNNSKEEGKKCEGKMCSRNAFSGRPAPSNVLKGEACDFVDFDSVRSSENGCSDGSKMVLKPS